MKGPWRVLSVHGSLHIFHFLWPDPNRNNYWLFFCILCNTNGIKGHWGHKGPPLLGQGPALVLQWTLPWPYNTPNMALYILAIFLHSMQKKRDQRTLGTQRSTLIGSRTRHGPSMDPAMALQYTSHGPLSICKFFCILCNKKGIKGLCGHKGPPSLGLGPALVLQWTLPWP